MAEDATLADLRHAASQDPTNGVLRHRLAAELAQQGDYDGAVLEFVAATSLDPTLHVARLQLGLLQLTMSHVQQSLATLSPLKCLDETVALRWFAEGLEALTRDDFSQSLDALRRGIALNQDNAPLNRDMQLLIDRVVLAMASPSPSTQANNAKRDVRTDFSAYGVTRH